MSNSTPRDSRAKSPSKKPKKPPFPLWLHSGTGQWAKKIRRKPHYFGTDKDAALKEYMRVKDDLEAGRTPRPVQTDGLTLHRLCNLFMAEKLALRDSGEIVPRTYVDAHKTCTLLLKKLGKTAVVEQITTEDLLKYRRWLAKTRNSNSLGNEVNRARGVFIFAFESGLIDRPVRFGGFKRPAKRVIRRQRSKAGNRTFSAQEIRKLRVLASPRIKAMILMAINFGAGNDDCARLEMGHLDLEKQWVDYPRPKTGIPRRAPLWPETCDALRKALEARQEPKDVAHRNLVFLTRTRGPWYSNNPEKPSTAITNEFSKLLKKAEITRPGLSFYRLRHTFKTIGEEAEDSLATEMLMGHVDESIAGTYRERFPDARLRKVTDHVHTWLFGEEVGR